MNLNNYLLLRHPCGSHGYQLVAFNQCSRRVKVYLDNIITRYKGPHYAQLAIEMIMQLVPVIAQ